MSTEAASEVKKHIEKLTANDLKEILSKTVTFESYKKVNEKMDKFASQNGNKAVASCSYECGAQGCNFDELLAWVSKYQNSIVADMMDDETKNTSAAAVCAKISNHLDTVKPRNHQGYYFHHHNSPILFLKNREVPHELYTSDRRDVVSTIDVESLVYYTMSSMKRGAVGDYMRGIGLSSTWQELAINTAAAAVGLSSVALAVRSKPPLAGALFTPPLLGALSVGMFAINHIGQGARLKREQSTEKK